MKTTRTFNVYFWVKNTTRRKDGRFPIYARINVDGKRADISLKRYVKEEHWDKKAHRLKARIRNSKSLNDYLDFVYYKLLDCQKQLLANNQLITAQAIKRRFLGTDKTVSTLSELLQYHEDFELKKLAPGTAKNYGATNKYLTRFVKEYSGLMDVSLASIDYAFLVGFENYLRNTEPLQKSQPLNNNGIMKHMERFQKLINVGMRYSWLKTNPFAQYQLKFEEFDSAFLNEDELESLKCHEIKKGTLDLVRDLFIFSCYTGLSYIEVKNLRRKSIIRGLDGEDWINVRRKKTNTPVKLPLLDESKRILEKYAHFPKQESDVLLPVISNQKVNQHLKTLANEISLDKHLTFHVARHTFATTVTLLNDVPLETVSKLLGHTKLRTTKKYARVVEKKISRDFKKLKLVLQQKSDLKSSENSTVYTGMRIV